MAGVRLPSRLSSALTVAGILITLPPLSARKRPKTPISLFVPPDGGGRIRKMPATASSE